MGFPGSEFYQRGGAAKLVALVDPPSAQPRHCGRGKTLPGRREFHDLIKMVNARQEREECLLLFETGQLPAGRECERRMEMDAAPVKLCKLTFSFVCRVLDRIL